MGSHCHCFVIRLVFWYFSQSLFPGCSVGSGIFSIFLLLLGLERYVWFTLGCLETKKSLDRHKWRKKKVNFFYWWRTGLVYYGWYSWTTTHSTSLLPLVLRQTEHYSQCVRNSVQKISIEQIYIYYERKKLKINLVKWIITHFFGTEDVFDVLDKFFLARWELPTFFCLPGPGTRSRLPCCVF